MNDAETEEILKIMNKWLVIGAVNVIFLFLTMLLIYYGNRAIVPNIVNQILAVIQFSLFIIAAIYLLKLRRLKNSSLK